MNVRTVVLSLEGLALAPLGPYGCSWNQTPQLDAIAAAGTVFDRCIVPSDDSLAVLRSLWQTWPTSHRRSVVSDRQAVIELAGGFDCAEVLMVEPEDLQQPADDVVETGLAGLLASGLDVLERSDAASDAPSLLWLHSDFLLRRWDAPRDLLPREQWDDEDEGPVEEVEGEEPLVTEVTAPKFFETVQPPALALPHQHDPDVTLAWMHTYAAQVLLIDVLLSGVIEALEDQPTRLILLGTSGFGLGENQYIGGTVGPLYSTRIQVPVIATGPHIPVTRCGRPCTPAAALEALFQDAPDQADAKLLSPTAWAESLDPLAPAIHTTSRTGSDSLTTPDWFYYQDAQHEALFVKPDDRNDFNNVARRMPAIVEQLREQTQRSGTGQ